MNTLHFWMRIAVSVKTGLQVLPSMLTVKMKAWAALVVRHLFRMMQHGYRLAGIRFEKSDFLAVKYSRWNGSNR